MKKQIHITKHDHERLKALLEQPRSEDEAEYLDSLQAELDRAKVVDARKIPNDVITMNSTVNVTDVESGEEDTYQLVYPHEADAELGKISVMAPLGTAMLGYRVGDVFKWKVPQGVKSWRVSKILYQPEAEGDFDR